MPKTVYIITYAKSVESLYGSLLVFDSIRVGYPTAEIVVIDNMSDPQLLPVIKDKAASVGATFIPLSNEMLHHELIWQLIQGTKGEVIFCDPDIIFWDEFETLEFTGLVAGRLIPAFTNTVHRCIDNPRLHTSLLLIPDTDKLLLSLQNIPDINPFGVNTYYVDTWYRNDTGGSLWAFLHSQMQTFTEEVLDKYDHLFCGTHIHLVAHGLKEPYKTQMIEAHESAKTNPKAVKGLWKVQEEFFNANKPQ